MDPAASCPVAAALAGVLEWLAAEQQKREPLLTVGSLFAGIGGFDLGLERTGGFRTVWQVENDPYARRVLEKHWPGVRRHDDVRTFPPDPTESWRCDVVCGGFPCQDISKANPGGKGLAGERSGLWRDFARAVRVLRPRIVLVENVPNLTRRGLGVVLGDLAALGFDAEWAVLPASAFGAVHLRARLFVVAHAQIQRAGLGSGQALHEGRGGTADRGASLQPGDGNSPDLGSDSGRPDAADADRPGRAVRQEQVLLVQQPAPVGSGWWAAEPDVGRVVHGFPGRVDRLRALGNAVVPQVAEWIGRRLLQAMGKE